MDLVPSTPQLRATRAAESAEVELLACCKSFFPLCLLEDHGKIYSAAGDGDYRSIVAYIASIGKPSVFSPPVSPFRAFRIRRVGDLCSVNGLSRRQASGVYTYPARPQIIISIRTSLSRAGTASTGHISSTSESRDLPRTDWISCPLCTVRLLLIISDSSLLRTGHNLSGFVGAFPALPNVGKGLSGLGL